MAIPETSNATISAPLLKELEATAQAEGRTVVNVLADAVRSYIDDRKWQSLVARGERRAKANGLRETDLPRLIEEVRSENRMRGLSTSSAVTNTFEPWRLRRDDHCERGRLLTNRRPES